MYITSDEKKLKIMKIKLDLYSIYVLYYGCNELFK